LLRFHDLRTTFVTWAKRASKSAGWPTARRHVTSQMSARCTRAARSIEAARTPSLSSSNGPNQGLGLFHACWTLRRRLPRKLEHYGVGHEGLEPSANGLRVHCSTN